MGLFSKLRKKALANKATGMKVNPDSPMGFGNIPRRSSGLFRGLPMAKKRMPDQETLDKFRQVASRPNPFARRMPISDMRLRDPRFEDRGGIMNLLRSRFGERPLRLPRPQMQMDMAPQPISQAPSGIGSLPNIDIQLPTYLKNIPNFMPKFDFSNIPQLPENFKFSPQFGGMVPGFEEGMDVNAIDRSPEQMIFALDTEANILLGEAEAQARGGNLDKANEMYRQVEAINNQIANMKGEIGDEAYLKDMALSGITNLMRTKTIPREQLSAARELGIMQANKIPPSKRLKIPGFSAGGDADMEDMDETIVTAPRIKVSKPTGFKQSTFEFLSSDPLADEEQSQLLSALAEEGSIQEMIEELLADRGRTLSDMDIMMLSQIFSPNKSVSMV